MENIFKSYQYTISAVNSFFTLLAIIVTLWLAYNSKYSKVSASINLGQISSEQTIDNPNQTNVIYISINNHGPHIIYIDDVSSFFWKPLFFKNFFMVASIYPKFKKVRAVSPGENLNLILSNNPNTYFQDIFGGDRLGNGFFKFIRLRGMSFLIRTTSGQVVKTKISNDLKQLILESQR